MNKLPEWLKDWMDFQSETPNTPESLNSAMDPHFLKLIQSDLNPSHLRVTSKLLIIHGITSLVSLMVCPQMGVGGFFGESYLMNLFMSFGHSICFLLCGAFFILGTLLMARLFLEVEERRRLFQDRFLVIPGIVIFSFGVLKMLGASAHSPDGFVYWIVGSLLAGFIGIYIFKKPKSFARL